MKYGSVCSGIEAATMAWHPLGWKPSFFSEIEDFPRAVLQHHYPDVPLHGDFTTIKENEYEPINLLVGGTPCQSFSIAGLRKGMDDDRGNLALEFLKLAVRLRPRWVVWENVPGVLSSNGGRDFAAFLGGLAECGYGFAYRVLDAQYVRVESHPFAVPQRRRRIFVVGYIGDWRPAASVLFERKSLSGNTAPRRKTGQGTTGCAGTGFEPRSPDGHARIVGDISPSLNTMSGGQREPCIYEDVAPVSPTLSESGTGVSRVGFNSEDQWFIPVIKTANTKSNGSNINTEGVTYTLDGSVNQAVFGFKYGQSSEARTLGIEKEVSPTILGGDGGNQKPCMFNQYGVRRLTPVECERLQGFPDNFTLIEYGNRKRKGKDLEETIAYLVGHGYTPEDAKRLAHCPDGPRYKALGNSMAVNVMRWIGERIKMVDNQIQQI